MTPRAVITRFAATAAGVLSAGAAFAQANKPGLAETLEERELFGDGTFIGVPVPGATSFQPAVTQNAQNILWLDNFMLVLITAISLFVVALLAYVILRYNSKANPNPASFTHNSPLEVAWTVVPVIILVVLGAVSLPVLFYQQEIPEGEVTIKATGNQWYWTYEYVDEGIEFGASMLAEEDVVEYGYEPEHFLLATDRVIVIPRGADVVVQVTGSDVIHAWKIPAFGVMQDGVPGRLADLWFNAEEEGWYFGQCSELCGRDHAYMPITVRVVSPEQYAAWVELRGGTPTAYIDSIGQGGDTQTALVAE